MIESAKTKTGLKVIANIIDKAYEKGKQVLQEAIDGLNIIKDEVLGQFDYLISPTQ